MNEQKILVFACLLDLILENVNDFIFMEYVLQTTTEIFICFSNFEWTLVTSTNNAQVCR